MLALLLTGFLLLAQEVDSAVEQAGLRLPAVIDDRMVLQRDRAVALWGWDLPGQELQVQADWMESGVRTRAGDDGRWRVSVKTPGAGGPHSIEIQGSSVRTLSDVLIGEVWICSGQSNMEWPLKKCEPGPDDLEQHELDRKIRLFDVVRRHDAGPLEDCAGTWTDCAPEHAAGFSGVGYFFARDLVRELDVPIGLIGANWGGTRVEAWTSAQSLGGSGEFAGELKLVERFRTDPEGLAAELGEQGSGPRLHQNSVTVLYNGMIAPLLRYAIRGVIWYQGESNRGRPRQYARLFPALIRDWRAGFGQGDFPFYYVQIAPYRYKGDTGQAALLREAQSRTISLSNTGMVVTMDLGNPDNIHPRDKQTVGHRLALWALHGTYGKLGQVPSGPVYERLRQERGALRLYFRGIGSGLEARGGALTDFLLAGDDRVFHPARAAIEDGSILLTSDAVPRPVAARYGWDAAAQPNLFNREGLPASSFRTDEWNDQ